MIAWSANTTHHTRSLIGAARKTDCGTFKLVALPFCSLCSTKDENQTAKPNSPWFSSPSQKALWWILPWTLRSSSRPSINCSTWDRTERRVICHRNPHTNWKLAPKSVERLAVPVLQIFILTLFQTLSLQPLPLFHSVKVESMPGGLCSASRQSHCQAFSSCSFRWTHGGSGFWFQFSELLRQDLCARLQQRNDCQWFA